MQPRVLVVDDDASSCGFIKEVLVQATGKEVLALTDSKSATAYLAHEKFAVVLLDLRMPPPDGAELTRQARSAGLNQMTPIILISEDQSTAATSQGFAAGAQFFLYKPIDKSRLLRLVRATQGAIEHERRRFRRVPLQARARLQIEKDEWEGETIDVSLNGMLVKVRNWNPGVSPVRVSLYAPHDAVPITGSGTVVRTLSDHRFGIQFNRLAPVETNRLQEFLLPMILNDDKGVPEPIFHS